MGNTNIALPGIGSWIAVAIAQKNLPAIFEAIFAMLVVILIYDQFMFRPLVAWADRFRVDSEPSEEAPQSWALTVYRRSRLLDLMTAPFEQMMRWSYQWHPPHFGLRAAFRDADSRVADFVWYADPDPAGALRRLPHLWLSPMPISAWSDLGTAVGLGFITMLRVMVLIAHRQRGLDADRRLCRPAPLADARWCSRWRNSWPPSPTICCSRWWYR